MDTVYKFIREQLKSNSSVKAIVFNNDSITYSELIKKVESLASSIVNVAEQEKYIGVTTDRSIHQIIAVLAIHLAGKTYVPIDLHLPTERLKQLISTASLKYYISSNPDGESTDISHVFNILDINKQPFHEKISYSKLPQTSNITYLLFTSGSTGIPKGVLFGHRAAYNLITWQKRISSSTTGTRTLQFAPLSFDVSFQEIFATLGSGGTLFLISDDERLDPFLLLDFIDKNKLNRLFLPFVALQYFAEECTKQNRFPSSLNEIITAGETLKITPQIKTLMANLTDAVLCNQYGPTETHVVTELRLKGNPIDWDELPSIGKPIDNTEIFILNKDLNEVDLGHPGELCVYGESLAKGYIGQDELTKEKFIWWVHPRYGRVKIYRTGDEALVNVNGTISFLGRKDTQVKIRGYRIELSEIELSLSKLSGIKQAVVIAKEDGYNNKRLIAYLIEDRKVESKLTDQSIKESISKELPEYMIPSGIHWLDDYPRTSSGKVDRKLLPAIKILRPVMSAEYKLPNNSTEKYIVDYWSQLFAIENIGIHDNFFDLGGNSLLAQNTISFINERSKIRIPITAIYQKPTPHQLANLILGEDDQKAAKSNYNVDNLYSSKSKDVAVIGMSLRFPGCETIEEFWDILINGKETTHFFKPEELELANEIIHDANFVAARGILKEADKFDASFFGIPPVIASLMDPQQRIFLEICRDVLESTGNLQSQQRQMIGVFAGCGNNSYYHNNVLVNPDQIAKIGDLQTMTLNEKDYIASRVAYQLNLHGPAISVHSACSTSLLAISTAVEYIRNGKCTMALAGGVAISSPIKNGHIYQEGSILSKDGHCRPFDKKATGTLFSDGAGVVLLKDAELAKADGNKIYAIIKGTGVNNDGSDKSSFSGPSAIGQSLAIRMAMNDAKVKAEDISYIEAHGTGTPIGDPIEIEGLNLAYLNDSLESESKQYCKIGSVKSNFGHLTAAAGVAGFIKTVLSLYHGKIPPSLHFNTPNPNIDFENSPFIVNDKLSDWSEKKIKIAGVSSFGIGGTNVHLIVEEFKPPEKNGRNIVESEPQLIIWSSKESESQKKYAEELADYIIRHSDVYLKDISYSLIMSRETFLYKNYIVSSSKNELIEKLKTFSIQETIVNPKSKIVFLYPGQGSQFINMGIYLYHEQPIFKKSFNECASLIKKIDPNLDLLKEVYPASSSQDDQINNTQIAQLSIFSYCYAVSKLWQSWGVQASAYIGHSLGEILAAHMAGVFSLEQALDFVSIRGKLMNQIENGKMLAVRAAKSFLKSILPKSINIAAINSPQLLVVSGSGKDIDNFSDVLKNLNIASKELNSTYAFHSPMVDPILEELEAYLSTLSLNIPRVPIVSSVTGKWLSDKDALSPRYWARHARETVQFSKALQYVEKEMEPIYLEMGMAMHLTAFVKQSNPKALPRSLSGIISSSNKYTVLKSIKNTLGILWTLGYSVNWDNYYSNLDVEFINNLPSYAYLKKRHWLNPANKQQENKIITEPSINKKEIVSPSKNSILMKNDFNEKLIEKLEEITGLILMGCDTNSSLIELGFDSLLLTQVAIALKNEYKVPLSFRQLNQEYSTIKELSKYLNKNTHQRTIKVEEKEQITENEDLLAKPQNKPFGASPVIKIDAVNISEKQETFLVQFINKYQNKTQKSKKYTEEHRMHMADPRVVSGFSLALKEITYPIVVHRSHGSKLEDIDGNSYVDVINGFGSNLFGYQPEWLKEVLHDQIEKGYEIGPQHPLAGEVCKLICDITKFDRAALCNTGSEAVLGAIRIARTATGRSLVVAFNGSYHGINDEVIVRGTPSFKSYPAAAGIPLESVSNILILEYGAEASLSIIQERSHEIAAILVEPVQSRMPELQPIDFLKNLRKIATNHECVLIFDEVITGFRSHLRGAQGLFGINADIATYGKVIGGGLPIGVIAGKKEFMDTLDGGTWNYDDQSIPEIGLTYFAGTFVRHPLVLATAKASLNYLIQSGPSFQEELTQNTIFLCGKLNEIARAYKIPVYIVNFSSLWKIKFKYEYPFKELIFALMREKNVHIIDSFPCFLTSAHDHSDLETIISAFEESIQELTQASLIPQDLVYEEDEKQSTIEDGSIESLINNISPVPNARIGKNKDGNPAWFIPDPNNINNYLELEFNNVIGK